MYKPLNSRDETRFHQFGRKLLDGILVDHVQRAGGGWSRELLQTSKSSNEFQASNDFRSERDKHNVISPYFLPCAEGEIQMYHMSLIQRDRRGTSWQIERSST